MRQEDWVLCAIKTIRTPYFIALYNSRWFAKPSEKWRRSNAKKRGIMREILRSQICTFVNSERELLVICFCKHITGCELHAWWLRSSMMISSSSTYLTFFSIKRVMNLLQINRYLVNLIANNTYIRKLSVKDIWMIF